MREKEFYEAPEVETIITIREVVMLAGSGANKADFEYDDENDLGNI